MVKVISKAHPSRYMLNHITQAIQEDNTNINFTKDELNYLKECITVAENKAAVKTVKEYVRVYPLEQFPLLKDFSNDLHFYSKGKAEYWEPYVRGVLKYGLRIVCRVLDADMYEVYVSLAAGPEPNLHFLGLSVPDINPDINSEDDVVEMLENLSDDFFNINYPIKRDKDYIQKLFIGELLSLNVNFLENEE